MEKLSLREELIITKISVPKRASKRLQDRWKNNEDGTDWALDIRPIFNNNNNNNNNNEDPRRCDDVDFETIPAAFCVATMPKEESDEKEDGERNLVASLERWESTTECVEEGTVQVEEAPQHVVFPCKTCGITFSSMKYVERHSKWCRGARTRPGRGEARASGAKKRYKCSTCGYATDVSSHLSAHLRRHTGERPYACHLCPYRAAEACTLARHRLAHSGARPYACPVCPHRAAFAGDLQKHVRRHTGERPFACLVCPYRAARPGSLKEHVLSQHRDPGAAKPSRSKLFPCYLCPYNAPALHDLTKHIQSNHPDLISLYKPASR